MQKQYYLITKHRGLTFIGSQLGGENSFSLSQFTSVRNTSAENQSLYWWCSGKEIILLEQIAVSSHVIFRNPQKKHYIFELYYSASLPTLSSKISSQSARIFCSLAALLNDQQSRWLSYTTNLAFWLWIFNYSQLLLLFFDPLLLVFAKHHPSPTAIQLSRSHSINEVLICNSFFHLHCRLSGSNHSWMMW